MEKWLYVVGGSVGSIGAFWIIINYVLTRLDSKLDITVFNEFGKRIETSLMSGQKRFDRLEAVLEKNAGLLSVLCREIGEIKGILKKP